MAFAPYNHYPIAICSPFCRVCAILSSAGLTSMDVTLLLCDWAEEINGKLYIMGAGWSQLRMATPANMSLAAKIDVPWDQTNKRHKVSAILLTEDGQEVNADGKPIRIDGEFEVGRPPGVTPGNPLDAPLTLRFEQLALPTGGYRWSFEIDGQESASASFRVENFMVPQSPEEGGASG